MPQFLRGQGKGWVTAEYSMLPRSTAQAHAARTDQGPASGRTQEIQRLIGRSLRAVVDLAALGERTDHSGLRRAAGRWRHAHRVHHRRLRRPGAGHRAAAAVQGDPEAAAASTIVAATSVGIVGGAPMLDLCYEEDSQADVDMNVVMTGSGRFVELQATAEHRTFDDEQMAQLIALARGGIGELVEAQKRVVQLT